MASAPGRRTSGTHVTLSNPGASTGVQAAGLAAADTATTAQTGSGLLAQSATVSFTRARTLRPGLCSCWPSSATCRSPSSRPHWPSSAATRTHNWQGQHLDTGGIMAFESVTGLNMDGDAGPTVWSHLLTAVAEGKTNPNGYAYSLVTRPRRRRRGSITTANWIETTLVNTGIPS